VLIDVASSSSSDVATRPITIAVDTLRAATTITTMHERGVEQVWLAENLAEAKRLKRDNPDALLCGEEGGQRPAGFQYGNSPAEFATLDLEGQTAILATSNGTPLLRSHASADVLLVGCLRNASAVAGAAAGPDRPLLIACAGAWSSGEPMLEDTFTAGVIVNQLIRIHEGFELTDGAQGAFETFLAHEGDAARAFAQSPHAQGLRSLGFNDDLAFCAETDVSSTVVMVEGAGDRLRTALLRG
jgi:2-phosphosulfolactate phosphatase